MASELLVTPSRATDADANPYSGARWVFYATGTTTPQAVYADAALAVSLGHVVTADSGGKFVPIYFDASLSYRGILENASGSVTIHDIDPINAGDVVELSQPSTGAFWTEWNTETYPAPPVLDAKIQRMNDRLFVGDATVNSGDFPSTTKDWLEEFEAERSHPMGFRTSWSQFASLATNGGIGVLGAARTSDADLETLQLAMGGCFMSVNDNTEDQQLATALYAVAFRLPGTGSIAYTGTCGGEIDIVNEGSVVQVTPADVYALGFTAGLQINSGAVSPFATTASHGLSFGNNGANFNTAIVVGQNALNGLTYDGGGAATGGSASAMRLGAFHQIEWWNNSGSAPSAKIVSEMLTPANAQSIIFKDTGIEFGGPANTGLAFATSYPGGATGAWLMAIPAHGVNPATLSADGATNADIMISPKGAGGVRFPIAAILNAANDAAAAGLGVSVGGMYRNGSVLMIRVA